MSISKRKLIIGISGASGAIYGVRLLEILQPVTTIETHLVISRTARVVLQQELGRKLSEITALADMEYSPDDLAACISSGSFLNLGMVVAPCSIRTMSEIATGVTSTLLSRAADVALKERRRLVMLVRETPLHTGHLRQMTTLSEMGAVIMPPVPAFYTKPKTLDDLINHTAGRVLDLFDIPTDRVRRWQGMG